MMSTSRNPRVVTRAVRPPLRSRMALVATVVAIRICPTSPRWNGRTDARRSMPSRVARPGSEGVLKVFANHEAPVASSRRTKSVKVPPVSIASRSIGPRTSMFPSPPPALPPGELRPLLGEERPESDLEVLGVVAVEALVALLLRERDAGRGAGG